MPWAGKLVIAHLPRNDVGATIESTEGVSPLSNLKVLVAEGAAENPRGEIYAKATDTDGHAPAVTQVRFTSLSPELRVWITATLEEAAKG